MLGLPLIGIWRWLNPLLVGKAAPYRGITGEALAAAIVNSASRRAQAVRSLNPRPPKIIGTHFSARAARVFACFAPET